MEKDILNIEETAEMLSLHPRTIRRYLKAGILKGTKIGGEWRIKRSDLKAMLEDPDVVHELSNTWNSGVSDFLAGKQDTPETGFRICTVIDCKFSGSAEAQDVSAALLRIGNQDKSENSEARFQYTYDSQSGKARFTLWGSPGYIIQMLSVLPTP
jgi:excisionase family DNA binding protein